jgi:hypothetical protein
MSGFFDSEEVRKSVLELDEIQDKIFKQLLVIPFADNSKKQEHLDLMKDFLEKQKNFIFRLSLSDDPEAVELKERILDSAKLLGMDEGSTVNEFFDILESQINELEKSLDI